MSNVPDDHRSFLMHDVSRLIIHHSLLIRSLTDQPVKAHFARSGEQDGNKGNQKDERRLTAALPTAVNHVVHFEKGNTHGNDDWNTGKPCEQAKNYKRGTEEFSKHHQGQ